MYYRRHRCCGCCPRDDDGPYRDYEAEEKRRKEASAKLHDAAVDLLATEEVVKILSPESVVYGVLGPGKKMVPLPSANTHAVLVTEAGSTIDLSLWQMDADLLRAGGVAYMRAGEESITIWTGKRRKVTAHVDEIMRCETKGRFDG